MIDSIATTIAVTFCNSPTVNPELQQPQPPQRTWVGLTDEEMHDCWDSPLTPLGMKHVRMIEAKLKEKNT